MLYRKKNGALGALIFLLVGMPGIEPGSCEPESHILPLYYIPNTSH